MLLTLLKLLLRLLPKPLTELRIEVSVGEGPRREVREDVMDESTEEMEEEMEEREALSVLVADVVVVVVGSWAETPARRRGMRVMNLNCMIAVCVRVFGEL